MRLRAIAVIAVVLLGFQVSFSQSSCNLSLIATPTGATCSNACNGSVTLTPAGGTAPYSFNSFDHTFPGTSVDTGVFAVRNGNYSVSGNVLTAAPNIDLANDFDNSLATKITFPDNGKAIAEASFYIDNNAYVNFGLAEDAVITDQSQIPFGFFFNYGELYVVTDGNWVKVGNYSANTWYDVKIEKTGSVVNYYMRNTGLATYNLVSTQNSSLTMPAYKLAATYYNLFDIYGGFKTRNWRVGGNPPTTGLCPGVYSYTVFDAMGCFASASVTIGTATGPTSLQLNGTVTGVSCTSASDGAVSLTPSGGTGPYTFGFAQVFGGGTINNSIFDLRNGNFSQGSDLREGNSVNNNNSWDNSIATKRTFSDGGYLLFQASFKFDPSAEVAFGFTGTGVIDDYNDLLAGFRIANGTLLYAYTNTGGHQQLGNIVANTWYDFKIEKLGTVVNYYTRLQNTGAYILRYSTTYNSSVVEYKIAALNFANFFSSSGGYNTTSWNVESTPKVSRMAPGSYTYTITDASGCTATATFNVPLSASGGVSLAATLVSASVSNGATGAVNLSTSGGTAPYKYQFEQTFSDPTIDEGQFQLRNGSFSQSGGDLRSNAVASSLSFDNSISTKISFPETGFISFEGSFKFDAGASVYFGLMSNASSINDPSLLQLGFYVSGTDLYARAGATNSQLVTSITSGTWYDLKVQKKNNLVKFFMRDGSGAYVQIYTMSYAGSVNEFKAGVVAYGASAGFNTKNWIVNSNPSLTSLAPGNYSYRVYDAKGCYSTAMIAVPSSGTFTPTVQSTNTSAWNVCDGTATISSNIAGTLTIGSRVFYETFSNSGSGSGLNSSLFTVRNGSFIQNGELVSGTLFNPSNWDNSIVTSQAFNDNGRIVSEMEMKFRTNTEVYFGFASATQVANTYTGMPYAFYYASGKLYAYTAEVGNVLLGNLTANQWYSFKIEKVGTALKFSIRLSTESSYQWIYTTTTANAVGANYKVGVVNYFSVVGNMDRAFNSRNWKVVNNANLTAVCTGAQTFTVSIPGSNDVDVTANVGTNLPLVRTITAPANVTVSTNTGVAYATNVALGSPAFAGPSAGITVSNNAPAQFPLGNTTVTWTARDAAGITATATQTVTVIDTEAPGIIAPPALNVNALIGQTSATVNLGTPVVTDNVGVSGVTVSNNAPAQFPIGTTTVTWTARDAAGNTATATQLVVVVSTQLPIVTAPANVTVSTNPGVAYATGVNLGTPSLSIVVLGLSITNNAPAQFPMGTTTVTWTVRDILGNLVTATQTVTVVDTEAPALTGPANLVVNTNPGVAYATGVNLGTPTVSDNVGGVTVTNNAPAQYVLGVNTITWTATDGAGNIARGTQTVTVKDNQVPTITAPANVSVGTNAGVAYATGVNLGTPNYSDNVPGATVSNNAPAQFPLGNTTVTWTVRDAAGNTASATQTVTVSDNELPTITAPANVTVNIGSNDTYATGVALGTPIFGDNVPGATVSNNAPAQFPVGVTTVTWTVRDAAGNTATASQTVTVIASVCGSVTASISSSTDGCGIKLIATGGTSYQWSYGGNVVSTSATVILGGATAAGVYTVKVSNSCGNFGTATYSYMGGSGSTTTNSNSYAIVGLQSVRLGENNDVNGSVGVTSSCGDAGFKKNSSVSGTVKAKNIYTQSPVAIGNKVFSAATVTLPAMQVYSGNCNSYSNYTVNQNVTVTLNSNYRDLYIKKGANVTLGGTIFKTITIEEGANVTFTSTTLNIESLLVGTGSTGVANVKFANNNVSVRVSQQVKVEEGNNINTDGKKVTFYVGDNNCDEEKFLVKGGSSVTADVYLPNGKIMVQSDCGHGYGCSSDGQSYWDYLLSLLLGNYYSSSNSSSSSCATTTMNGTFIAEDVESGKGVTWNGPASASCSTLNNTDNVDPIINCPAAQQFCQSSNGNYTIPALSSTDNSGLANTVSYSTSGATSRNGSGNDASGAFNIGTTNINWTVTDANGNSSTCTTVVKVTGGVTASIAASSDDVFCGTTTLTASCATSGATYQWTLNNAIVGAGNTLTLDNNSDEGSYKLKVTVGGCTTTEAASYNYSFQNQLYKYTIIGLDDVKLGENNNVQSGSVGVMNNGEAEFKKGSSVAGPGSFVKAKYIDVQNSNVNITNKIYSSASVTLPTMQYYSGNCYYLSSYTVAQNATVTLSGNYQNLTINKGATVTLNGSIFRTISIAEGAKVTFTNTTLNIETITMSKGTSSSYTVVKFANNTSIRINKQVKIDESCQVNPDNKRVVWYVGDMQCDEEKFYVQGYRTSFNGFVYAPTGVIKVTGAGSTTSSTACYMNGVFIAEDVISEAKGVIWNGSPCNNSVARGFSGGDAITVGETPVKAEGIKISTAPNPSVNFFKVSIQTNSKELVTLRVTDLSGRVIETIANQEASTIFRLGEKWSNGAYMLEVIQGTERKTVQLLKLK